MYVLLYATNWSYETFNYKWEIPNNNIVEIPVKNNNIVEIPVKNNNIVEIPVKNNITQKTQILA